MQGTAVHWSGLGLALALMLSGCERERPARAPAPASSGAERFQPGPERKWARLEACRTCKPDLDSLRECIAALHQDVEENLMEALDRVNRRKRSFDEAISEARGLEILRSPDSAALRALERQYALFARCQSAACVAAEDPNRASRALSEGFVARDYLAQPVSVSESPDINWVMRNYPSALAILGTPGHADAPRIVTRLLAAWDLKDGFLGAELGGLLERALRFQTASTLAQVAPRKDRIASLESDLGFAIFTNWGEESRDSLETLRREIAAALRDFEAASGVPEEVDAAARIRRHVETLEISIIDE
jgi:hypothetical protein